MQIKYPSYIFQSLIHTSNLSSNLNVRSISYKQYFIDFISHFWKLKAISYFFFNISPVFTVYLWFMIILYHAMTHVFFISTTNMHQLIGPFTCPLYVCSSRAPIPCGSYVHLLLSTSLKHQSVPCGARVQGSRTPLMGTLKYPTHALTWSHASFWWR